LRFEICDFRFEICDFRFEICDFRCEIVGGVPLLFSRKDRPMGRDAICEFPRSQSVTAGDLRFLETQHEGMAGNLKQALSELLRSPVEATLAGVEQCGYGKFVHNLADLSCFNVLKAAPLGDCLMLDVELAILYPMLDRMLGGGHEDEPSPRRALSDIELPLAARIVRVILEQLRQAWQGVVPLKCEVLQVESQPRRLRALPSEESVAIVGFVLTIGGRQGMIRLCVPCRAVRQLADRLVCSRTATDGDLANAVDHSLTEAVVTLASSAIAAGDLRELRVGDVIATETGADREAVVSVGGEPKFRGKPGTCDGCKAVVLTEAIGDSNS
jgi:flagellar motor switch protein FliM